MTWLAANRREVGDAQRGAAACRVVQQDEIKTQWQENHTKTHIDQLFSPFPDAEKLQNVPIALAVFVLWELECHVAQMADEAVGAGNSTKHFFWVTLIWHKRCTPKYKSRGQT